MQQVLLGALNWNRRAASGKLSTGQFSIPPFRLPSTLYYSFK